VRTAREALLWLMLIFLMVSGYYQRQINREVTEIIERQRRMNRSLHERILFLESSTAPIPAFGVIR